jgi:RHS repeat-associated protein
VLVTISDKKLGVDSDNDGVINYYNADMVTANDYYPFGSQMPGRKYAQANSSYRYGFNGQENSTEIAEGITTAKFWEYDSRIGRRWNVDPVFNESESRYLCFGGNPIWFSDPFGDVASVEGPGPKTGLKIITGSTSSSTARVSPYGGYYNAKLPKAPTSKLLSFGKQILKLGNLAGRSPATLLVIAVLSPSNSHQVGMKSPEQAMREQNQMQSKIDEEDKFDKDHPNERIRYVTYIKTKINDDGSTTTYSGRTSGLATMTAAQIVANRDKQHLLTNERLDGYGPADVDRETIAYGRASSSAKFQIRGREQQLIDFFGKAISDNGTSGNLIRGVSKINRNAQLYHTAASFKFGELHKFTGF